MKKNLFLIQSMILALGTAFAWSTVYNDFNRFYGIYGSFTRINNCVIPNPITTPCFYGAFAFLFAFIWSLLILKKEVVGEKISHQKKLNILLIASTMFAWSNFGLELFRFYTAKPGSQLSCSGVPTNNVFITPCFIGSITFLAGLVISIIIIRVFKKR